MNAWQNTGKRLTAFGSNETSVMRWSGAKLAPEFVERL